MSDNFARLLSFGIGIVFFIFYITIVNSILNHDILSFPYIILTIYFFISVFTLPMVSLETGEKTKNWIPRYALLFAYLVSPIWLIVNIIKNKD